MAGLHDSEAARGGVAATSAGTPHRSDEPAEQAKTAPMSADTMRLASPLERRERSE